MPSKSCCSCHKVKVPRLMWLQKLLYLWYPQIPTAEQLVSEAFCFLEEMLGGWKDVKTLGKNQWEISCKDENNLFKEKMWFRIRFMCNSHHIWKNQVNQFLNMCLVYSISSEIKPMLQDLCDWQHSTPTWLSKVPWLQISIQHSACSL